MLFGEFQKLAGRKRKCIESVSEDTSFPKASTESPQTAAKSAKRKLGNNLRDCRSIGRFNQIPARGKESEM